MNKLLLILLFIFICNFKSNAWYSRICSNGGFFGYSYTSKECSNGNTSITCSDPGFASCPTMMQPNDRGSDRYNLMITKIINAIEHGTLSGKFIENGLIGVWESSDIKLTNSNIRIDEF